MPLAKTLANYTFDKTKKRGVMNSKTALIFVIPGSVSLFVLLQFLQETAVNDDGLKFSNLLIMRRGATPDAGTEVKAMFADINDQFAVLLVVTILFLAPPVIWLLVNVYKDAKARKELREKGNETSA